MEDDAGVLLQAAEGGGGLFHGALVAWGGDDVAVADRTGLVLIEAPAVDSLVDLTAWSWAAACCAKRVFGAELVLDFLEAGQNGSEAVAKGLVK